MSDWEGFRDLTCDRNNRLRNQIAHVHECVGASGKSLDEAFNFLLRTVMMDTESVKGGFYVGIDVPELGALCNRIIDLRAEQEKVLDEVAKFWDRCGGPVGSIEMMMMLIEERVDFDDADDSDDADGVEEVT